MRKWCKGGLRLSCPLMKKAKFDQNTFNYSPRRRVNYELWQMDQLVVGKVLH